MLPLTTEDKFVPLDLTDSQRNVALGDDTWLHLLGSRVVAR